VRVDDVELGLALDRSDADTGTAMVLAHGAGGHMDHATTMALSAALSACGVDVVRFNFPYRAAGRKAPDRMPRLLVALHSVVECVNDTLNPDALLLGGHSMGGRTASMAVADGLACAGLVLCAYPLHAPGKPDRLRAAHLSQLSCPVLCFNGTRDNFCTPELMNSATISLASWTQHWLDGADHGYAVLKRSGRTREEVFNEIEQAFREWLSQIKHPPAE
jgi:hypothetical protein